MTYRDEFLLNVGQFMRRYTLYLPGEGNDGGKIDLDDPTYSQFKAAPGAISVPAVPVVAAWREGAKKNHLQLKLHTSRDYKMAHTGRTVPTRTVDSDVVVQAPLMGTYDVVTAQAQQEVFDAGFAGPSAKAAVRDLMTGSGARLDASERLNCYFLPWFSGRTVEMTLGGNADRFFTATMNGCTFQVAGTAQAPIARHHNDTRLGDDTDPTVDRGVHQQRYAVLLNPALPGEAALSKYPVPNFAGQNAT